MNSKIAIVIVTYNPTEILIKNLKLYQLISTIDCVVVVDNTGKTNKYIEEVKNFSKVKLIINNKNIGLGKAQNNALDYLIKMGYEWAITFDQDSEVFSDLIIKYAQYISSHICEDVAIISTDYIDKGTEKKSFGNTDIISANIVISSGSLLNLKIYKMIGKFKEEYFIDQIDNEYCYRCIRNGYRIIVLPGVGFYHQMGNIRKVPLLNFYLYNQSPNRVYYRARNSIIFAKTYNDKKLKWIKMKIIIIDLIKIFFEKRKIIKLKMYFIGIIHGVLNKTGELKV